MSGLEKIIDAITGEADLKAQELLLSAEKEVSQIGSDADARTLEETDRIRKKSLDEVSNIETRAKASADLRKKQILLEARQDLINSCISKAKAYPDSLSDAEYIALLTNVFKKHVPEKDAVLKLNERDMKRITEDVKRHFAEIARKKAVLSASHKSRRRSETDLFSTLAGSKRIAALTH